MKVSEIFSSIQGESTYAGLSCTFIRLAGCNLKCSYCDTSYARDEAVGAEYSVTDLIKEARMRGVGLVEITGGEPLLQPESPALIKMLLDDGFRVLVETNGSMSLGGVDPRAVVIMDVKTPGSGMAGSTEMSNLDVLKAEDEVKFVISDRADYEWAKGFMFGHSIKCTTLMSPCFGTLEAEALVRWILEDRLPVRLNLQLHKYVFGPGRRGV